MDWNDDSTPVNTNYYTMPQLNIWKDIMEHAHEGLEYTEFQKPYNIVEAEVCASSGKLAIPGLCDSDPRGSQVIKEYLRTVQSLQKYVTSIFRSRCVRIQIR